MATTKQRPAPVDEHHAAGERADKNNRNRNVALAVLAVIALVVGIALVAATGGDDSDVPSEVQDVLDEFERATEEENIEALTAIVTDDYHFNQVYFREGEDEPEYTRAGDIGSAQSRFVTTQELLIQRVGDPVVDGEGPWIVTVEENFSDQFTLFEGTGTYTIVDEGGVMKIETYDWSGLITPLDPMWGG